METSVKVICFLAECQLKNIPVISLKHYRLSQLSHVFFYSKTNEMHQFLKFISFCNS